MRAVAIAFLLTFSRVFDVPVFWPILVIYFVALFAMTMKTRIAEMIKHKYVPFAFGKKRYAGAGKKKGDGGGRDGGGGGGGVGGSSGFASSGGRPLGAPTAEVRFTSHAK